MKASYDILSVWNDANLMINSAQRISSVNAIEKTLKLPVSITSRRESPIRLVTSRVRWAARFCARCFRAKAQFAVQEVFANRRLREEVRIPPHVKRRIVPRADLGPTGHDLPPPTRSRETIRASSYRATVRTRIRETYYRALRAFAD